MKILTLLALLLLAVQLPARDLTFAWDPSEGAEGYTLFIRPVVTNAEPAAWTEFGSSTTTTLGGTFPDHAVEIAVSAWRDLPDAAGNPAGRLDSRKSAPLSIPATPGVPAGLRVKITIDLETSENSADWRPIATISFPDSAAPKQFFRIKAD